MDDALKRCPICNKSSDEILFFGELCEECVRKKMEAELSLPSELRIEVCRSCGKVLIDSAGNAQSANKGSVAKGIERRYGQKIKEYSLRVIKLGGESAVLELVGDYEGHQVRIVKEVLIRGNGPMCRQCSLKAGGYYEAVIQLRGNPDKVARTADRIILFAERHGTFVSKREDMDYGCDLYVGSKDAAGAYFSIRKLKPTRSFILYGVRNGRKVYRNVYALHL